jgi:hypothetical protein
LIWRYAAFGWLVFLTAMNVYRAATWSMTIDEARVFIDFIATPFQALFTSYDACYHVLHTWLTRFAVGMLGRGEWVVRLPGLVAAVFYFAAVWKLANRMMGAGPLHLLAVVVLSANPLIFDHLSLARGYGLALTLFTWAFYHLMIAASEGDAKRITKAAYLMGLSVAANLTFAFPVTGLVVMFLVRWIRREGWRPGELIDRLLLPMIVPPILILMIPLSRMAPNPFYFGVDRLRTSWQNLFQSSVSPGVYPPEWAKFMEVWVMPVVALLVIIAAAAAWKKLEGAAAHALVFAAGSMTLAVAALVVGHHWAGVPYPFGRTGLYLVWLGLAAWLAALRAPKWREASRMVPWILGLTLAVLGVRYVALTSVGVYQEFPDHAEVKQAVRQLRELQAAAPKPAQVGGSWEYIPGLNYYRLRYRLRWMAQVNHGGLKEGFDYYVLTQRDGEWVEKLRLRRVWTGPRTGIIVAVPGR